MSSQGRDRSRRRRPQQRWSWAGGRSLARDNENQRFDTGNYWARPQDEIRLERLPPGAGYRHLVTITQLRGVVGVLPDWEEVAVGLEAIALAPGRGQVEGVYQTGFGVVDICAWPRGLWVHAAESGYVAAHQHLLDLFGVDYRRHGRGYEIRWTASQARAYQLLHILPHELGHHHDLITSRCRRAIGRGEEYAEQYAHRVLEEVWPVYARAFEIWPRRASARWSYARRSSTREVRRPRCWSRSDTPVGPSFDKPKLGSPPRSRPGGGPRHATVLVENDLMPAPKRRSAMKVRDGRVQKKNNWRLDRDDYFAVPQAEIRIDRRDPAWGRRHLITVPQLRTFVDLLPDWDEVAVGLRAIVLDSADDCMGWHDRGVVAVCAWEHELWWDMIEMDWVSEHQGVLERLDVNHRVLTHEEVSERLWEAAGPPGNPRTPKGQFAEIRWSEAQAGAFQLLHVLPHELGHHHDRMTTRSRRRSARGEAYAERYAHRVMEVVWPAYARTFGL